MEGKGGDGGVYLQIECAQRVCSGGDATQPPASPVAASVCRASTRHDPSRESSR